MLGYYIELAFASFMRNTLLTLLMVLAIALGIATSMTTLTVFHVLSGDPLPDKSSKQALDRAANGMLYVDAAYCRAKSRQRSPTSARRTRACA